MEKYFSLIVFCFFCFFVSGMDFEKKLDRVSSVLKENREVLNFKRPNFNKKGEIKPYGAFLCLNGVKKNMPFFKTKDGDLVVGYSDPDQSETLSGTVVVRGDIYVVNNGVLTFDNASIVLYGNIVVTNNGVLNFKNSSLKILSRYAYSNAITVFDGGSVSFDSCFVDSNGFNWSGGLVSNASLNIKDTVFKYGFTTAVMGNSSANVENSNPLEWVIDNAGSLTIKDSVGPFMLWPVFCEGSVADLSFPDGDSVSYFEISDEVNGISGVSIKLVVENCKDVLWGMMVKNGSSVTVRDSVMKTTGIMADAGDEWDLTGISNNQYFTDYTLPVNQVNLRYVNTSVEVFNVYQMGAGKTNIADSVVGEIGIISGEKSTVFRTLVDGTGGYFFTNGNTETTFLLSSLLSHTVSGEDSIALFINSSLANGDIVARDNAVVLLANTVFSAKPRAYDNAFIIDCFLDIPSIVSPNSLQEIEGSANVVFGENCPVRFESYSLLYGLGDEPDNWVAIADNVRASVDKGVLGVWNTGGLEGGIYTVKLVLNLNMGQPIEITRRVFLGDDGLGEKSLAIPHIDNGDYWESYLVFDNTSENALTADVFTFSKGEFLKKERVELNPFEQKKVSLYGDCGFVRCDSDVSVREFFVSRIEGGIAQFNLKDTEGKTINFLMPYYAGDSLTWEGIALKNDTYLPVVATLNAYSPDGSILESGSVDIGFFGKKAGLVETFFPNTDFSQVSRVKCLGDGFMSGLVISGRGNKSLLFTPAVNSGCGGEAVIPHIANEWDTWQSVLIIDNLGDEECNVYLSLYSDGESVLDGKEYGVAANSQLTLNLNDFKSLSPQWGVAVSDGNIAVREGFKAVDGGTAEFLLSSDTSQNLIFNLPKTEEDKLNWCGIAITNPSGEQVFAVLNAYDGGELIQSANIAIQPYTRIVGVLRDFFPQLDTNFVVRVEVVSDKPLTGLTISGYNQDLLLFSNPVFK